MNSWRASSELLGLPADTVKLSTRGFSVKTLAIGALITALSSSFVGAADAPVRIGMTNHFTGTAAVYARSQRDAIELAVEEWNAKGGVLGRKIELVVRDDQLKPDLGISHARDLITREKVDALLGPGSSGVAVSVSGIAGQYKKIIMLTTSNSPRLTMDLFHPYVFTVAPTGLMEARAWAETLGEKYTKFGFIGGDYEASHQYLNNFRSHLAKVNPKAQVMVEAWPKLGESDFTPYITRLLAAEPEVVYSGLWGADLVAFIKQARPYDFFKRTKLATILTVDDLIAIGNEMPEGVLGQMRAPFFGVDSPRMKEFVRRFKEKTGNYPSDWAVQGYEGMDALASAIQTAGSTESAAIAKALESLKYEGLRGTITFRESDHQGSVPSFIGTTVKLPDYPFLVMKDITRVPAEKLWPSQEEIDASRKK